MNKYIEITEINEYVHRINIDIDEDEDIKFDKLLGSAEIIAENVEEALDMITSKYPQAVVIKNSEPRHTEFSIWSN